MSDPQRIGTGRSWWCWLLGHRWHVCVNQLHIPKMDGTLGVYKTERCRRCDIHRTRDDEPVRNRSVDTDDDQ